MPKNPFIQHQNAAPKLKRNSYDLSFQNNLSLKIGYEYPVLVKEANPGDSFRIKAGAFLRAFPTVFPVQTPIRMTLHIFKVYNRTLQKNWMDFIYNNDTTIEHPYISPERLADDASVGSVYDFMGVPVNFFDKTSRTLPTTLIEFRTSRYTVSQLSDNPFAVSNFQQYFEGLGDELMFDPWTDTNYQETGSLTSGLVGVSSVFSSELPWSVLRRASFSVGMDWNYLSNLAREAWPHNDNEYRSNLSTIFKTNRIMFALRRVVHSGTERRGGYVAYSGIDNIVDTDVIVSGSWFYNKTLGDMFPQFTPFDNYDGRAVSYEVDILFGFMCPDADFSVKLSELFPNRYVTYDFADGIQLTELPRSEVVKLFNEEKINALPFRALEAIHNSFYRDNLNDPWELDGKPQYNNYITTHEDGIDNTRYHLFQRNWEKDFLTSAYPSPQQGLAPLVGITSRGVLQFQRADGSVAEVQSEFDEDGVITGFKMNSELAKDGMLRMSAMDVASQGISINDLRQVGSLQRWLESNIRRGYRYREQVMAHTGVKIDYDELDMPEFIGGYSRIVNTTQINQTTDGGDGSPLGSYAGQLSFFNSMGHSCSTFFKEHGWLIGILTITPVPAYSQLMPKMLLKTNPLDYFSPEFAHIGMQPITYREVCPVQVHFDPHQSHTLTDTFGYQRPFYDLIASVDEVHGQMRTSMRDFIMNRTFDGVPELDGEFLHVDPSQVNQVFTYTDESADTFFGQIVFDIQKKTAIPRSGIPMLNA